MDEYIFLYILVLSLSLSCISLLLSPVSTLHFSHFLSRRLLRRPSVQISVCKQEMNRCGFNQSAMAASDSVVCPKPQRIGLLNPFINDQIRPSRWLFNQQTEISDSKAGAELLDIILSKGNYGVERSNLQVASSPPFFCGSPPSRASNPLIQDSQFGNKEFGPLSQAPIPATSPSPSARKSGSCVRVKFGQKPAAVRVEGFDCLSRDRRSVSAVA